MKEMVGDDNAPIAVTEDEYAFGARTEGEDASGTRSKDDDAFGQRTEDEDSFSAVAEDEDVYGEDNIGEEMDKVRTCAASLGVEARSKNSPAKFLEMKVPRLRPGYVGKGGYP